MSVRSGENEKTWFRGERYYCVNGGWYYMTREGEEAGPFDSRTDAESELMLYLRHVREMEGFQSEQK